MVQRRGNHCCLILDTLKRIIAWLPAKTDLAECLYRVRELGVRSAPILIFSGRLGRLHKITARSGEVVVKLLGVLIVSAVLSAVTFAPVAAQEKFRVASGGFSTKGQTPESLRLLDSSVLDEIKKSGFIDKFKR